MENEKSKVEETKALNIADVSSSADLTYNL